MLHKYIRIHLYNDIPVQKPQSDNTIPNLTKQKAIKQKSHLQNFQRSTLKPLSHDAGASRFIRHTLDGFIRRSLPAIGGAESSIKHRVSSIEYRVSSIEYRVSSIEYRESSIKHRVSSIEYRVSSIENRASAMTFRYYTSRTTSDVSRI